MKQFKGVESAKLYKQDPGYLKIMLSIFHTVPISLGAHSGNIKNDTRYVPRRPLTCSLPMAKLDCNKTKERPEKITSSLDASVILKSN